jgi:predicted PurR-regulated permease PerM
VAGWLTGLVLVAVVAWLLLSRRARLRRALRRARAREDDGETARLGAELARRRRGRS